MKAAAFAGLAGIAILASGAAMAQTAPATPPAPSAASAPVAKATVAALSGACLPLVRGAAVTKTASAAGFRNNDGGWELRLAGGREVDLGPPDVANPHLCTLSLTYAPADSEAIHQAIAAWAAAQAPPLAPVQVEASYAGSLTVSTWSGQTPSGVEAVALDEQAPPAAGSAPGKLAQATVEVSLTPAQVGAPSTAS